jgi:hypothetical protein
VSELNKYVPLRIHPDVQELSNKYFVKIL